MSDEEAMMPISATRREVMAQPEVLTRVLHGLSAQVRELAQLLAGRGTRQILLVGSGDSWFAGMASRIAFEQYAGLEAEAIQAYEYAVHGRPGVDATSALIIISSSGRPTTTWDALDRALLTPAYVVGITDKPYPGNPFRERVHTALVPGAEKVGWPAQTTSATIALLIMLAIELGRARHTLADAEADQLINQLLALPQAMAQTLATSEGWAADLAQRFYSADRRRIYTFVGSGSSLGVAYTGMALLAEGPQEVGIAIAAEEFHHGLHIATIAKDDVVLLIAPTGAGSARMLDTARSVSAWGAHLVAIVDTQDQAIRAFTSLLLELPGVPEAFSPLLTLMPLHQLSIQMSAHKVASGYQRPKSVP